MPESDASAPVRSHTRYAWACFALLAAAYFVLVVSSSRQLSPAYDEPIHIRAGMAILTGGAYVDPDNAWWTRIDPLTPPIDVLPALLARISGQSPDYRTDFRTGFRHVLAARWASHIMGALALLLVFWWGLRIWGAWGGMISATSLLSLPIFIAHGSIVSTDIGMTLGGLIAACAIWHFALNDPDYFHQFDRRSWLNGALIGLSVGFALACKLSNVAFFLILPLAAGWVVFRDGRESAHHGRRRILRWFAASVWPLLIATLLAAIAYEAGGSRLPPFQLAGRSLQLPIGHSLARSLITALSLEGDRPPIFFNGWIEAPSSKHFAAAYLYKVPLPLIALHAAGLLSTWVIPRKRPAGRAAAYLAALAGLLAVLFAARGVYLGLRQLLLPLALLCLLAGGIGSVSAIPPRGRKMATGVIAAILCWGAVESVRARPWHLSYFNPLARGRLALVDSDGDWGEGLLALAEWQNRWSPNEPIWLAYFGNSVPDDFGIRYRGLISPYGWLKVDPEAGLAREPAKMDGWVVISRTQLAGTYMPAVGQRPDFYAEWRNRPPDFVIGGTLHIYDRRRKDPP